MEANSQSVSPALPLPIKSGKSVNWEPINFTIYFSFVRWTVILTIVVELILRIVFHRFLIPLTIEVQELIYWLWRLGMFVFLSWRIMITFGATTQVGIIAGVISGVLIGFVVALYRFFEGFKIWKIFNLLTETVIVGLVGGLMVYLIIVIYIFYKNRIKK